MLTEQQVRGHMNNPVAWQVWDAEAMELAKKHNRLIFLSIGYSACHCKSQPLLSEIIGILTLSRVPCHGKGIFHVIRGGLDSEPVVRPDQG